MRCCGYSLTQSPTRIAAAVMTGAITVALAIRTGFVAYEIFSGCPNSASTPTAFYNYYTIAANCDQQQLESFVTGVSTLAAAAVTAVLAFTKQPKAEVVQTEAPDPAEIKKLIQDIVAGDVRKPRSLSVGATPRRLAQGVNGGVVVVDPSKPSQNAALRADLQKIYPEATS